MWNAGVECGSSMRVLINHRASNGTSNGGSNGASNGVWRRQMPLDPRCVCVCVPRRRRRRRAPRIYWRLAPPNANRKF